jgi:hypothetical protein
MVIKATVTHSGWSYGNGDDQYDNESLGSTKTAVKLEKSMENSCRNKKNGYEVKMCSKQDDKSKNKNTNDQGWTKIDKTSKRKLNSTNNRSTTIDSIISSIDIELNIDMNGTLEATIDSPTRKNRCVVPDRNEYNTKAPYQAHKQEQTPVITTTKDDKRNDTTSENTPTRTTMRTKYEQGKGQEEVQETD